MSTNNCFPHKGDTTSLIIEDSHKPLTVISRRVYDYLTERYPRTHYYPFFLRSKENEE